MTLTQLKYAITVAHARSMNEAARRLFISQPSLSSAIKELETEIGLDLFRRTNRGVSVTPEGEEFIGYAALYICSKCLCRDGETIRHGRIRVCCP